MNWSCGQSRNLKSWNHTSWMLWRICKLVWETWEHHYLEGNVHIYKKISRLKLNSKRNCLTSRTSGMNGSITINGQERNLSQFRKLSCYIMQDNQLHANLTVEEAMHVASNLKLGKDMKKDEKQEVVSSGKYYKQLCQIKKTSRTCINQGIDERILLDWIFKGIGCPDSSGWGCGPVLGSCQHGNELSGSVKEKTFHD